MGVHVTYMWISVTYTGVNVTYMGVNVTYMGVSVTYTGVNSHGSDLVSDGLASLFSLDLDILASHL